MKKALKYVLVSTAAIAIVALLVGFFDSGFWFMPAFNTATNPSPPETPPAESSSSTPSETASTTTVPATSEATAPTVMPTTPETFPATTAPEAVVTEPTEPVPTEPTTPVETTVPQETKHVHSYTEKRKEPTCTRDGTITGTCACGKTYKDYITMLGHDWSEWVITKEPTTETTGDRERSCGRCGLKEKDFVAPLDKETGEKYVSYIDPKITTTLFSDGARCYEHKEAMVDVIDTRSWGEPPSIYVEEDGSLRVIYFQRNGEKVEIVHSPVAGKFHRGVILDDGTFFTSAIGDLG